MLDTLTELGHNLEPVPHLAESWEMSEDGLTWTFHLRRGVRFHDGTPFNAEAVAFTLNRLVATGIGGRLPQLKETVVVDEYTVELRLTEPAPMFPFDLASDYIGMLSPAAVEKYGEDFGILNMVGTGPFKFHEFIPGDRVVLVRNEEYTWGPAFVENRGPAFLDRIVLKVIPEDMTRVMEFEDRVGRGEAVFMTAIPTGDVLRLKADPAIQTITRPSPGAEMIWINITIWPFDDIRVREALIHAIDTEAIIEFVMDGLAIPAITHLAPSQIGYEHAIGPIKPVVRQFDPERARQLFAEAGWLPGPDGILVHQETGTRAEFGLLSHPLRIPHTEVIKAQLREVGLDIRITILEPAASVAKAREGEVELFLISYGWPDVLRPLFYFHTDMIGGLNFAFFKNPQYDEMVDIAHTALDPEVRHAAMNEALVFVMEHAIYVPMWHLEAFAMATADVVGGMELLGAHPLWALDIFALDLYIR